MLIQSHTYVGDCSQSQSISATLIATTLLPDFFTKSWKHLLALQKLLTFAMCTDTVHVLNRLPRVRLVSDVKVTNYTF